MILLPRGFLTLPQATLREIGALRGGPTWAEKVLSFDLSDPKPFHPKNAKKVILYYIFMTFVEALWAQIEKFNVKILKV